MGLSPRARGNLGLPEGDRTQNGTIPACAGEPSCTPQSASVIRDYPRVRGGTRFRSSLPPRVQGLSPRARGNHTCFTHMPCFARTIPACAGEPSPKSPSHKDLWDYPRVRGGTRLFRCRDSHFLGLSPRARGNPKSQRKATESRGTIPACAGEPPKSSTYIVDSKNYPRVRGGTRDRDQGFDL